MRKDRRLALGWAREDQAMEGLDLSTEAVIDRAFEYDFFLMGLDPMTAEEDAAIDAQLALTFGVPL